MNGKSGESMASGRLRRSVSNRMIAGVCGGISEYLGLDVTATRVGYVLLSLLSGVLPSILVYIILWAVIPEREYF